VGGTMRQMARPAPMIVPCRCKGVVEDRARNGSPRLAAFATYRPLSCDLVVLKADKGAALPQQHGEGTACDEGRVGHWVAAPPEAEGQVGRHQAAG
jgi:hypothetical protein